jgi:hypothetical protein
LALGPYRFASSTFQPSSTMSSASPSRILVSHTYATDSHLPSNGEVIVVRLSQDLFGPGSTLGSARDLPSHATRRNYHLAIVIDINLNVFESIITLTVLPMPAYSATDPISGLSSTSWLLSQPADYQKLHIPVPYEQIPPLTRPHPPFPTPVQFGDPIEMGGWKNRTPSWIQVVPMLTPLKYTTKVRNKFSRRQVLLANISDTVQMLRTTSQTEQGRSSALESVWWPLPFACHLRQQHHTSVPSGRWEFCTWSPRCVVLRQRHSSWQRLVTVPRTGQRPWRNRPWSSWESRLASSLFNRCCQKRFREPLVS